MSANKELRNRLYVWGFMSGLMIVLAIIANEIQQPGLVTLACTGSIIAFLTVLSIERK